MNGQKNLTNKVKTENFIRAKHELSLENLKIMHKTFENQENEKYTQNLRQKSPSKALNKREDLIYTNQIQGNSIYEIIVFKKSWSFLKLSTLPKQFKQKCI